MQKEFYVEVKRNKEDNIIIDGSMVQPVYQTISLVFEELYRQVKNGKADLEDVENFIFNVYGDEELYLMIEEDDLKWKKFQSFEKYMNHHGVFYGKE